MSRLRTYTFQQFGLVGSSDKCQWCGRKLRKETRYKTVETGETWTDLEGAIHPRTEMTTVLTGRLGDYGDNFFCGLRCGYSFGLRMAQLGRFLEIGKK